MKMRKSLFAVGLAFVLCLGVFSAAFAAEPEDALSPVPEKSVAMVLRVDDLGGFLRWAMSEGNLKIFAPIAGLDEDTIGVFTAILASVPAKAAALSTGMTADMAPFFQAAVAGSEGTTAGEFLLGAGNPMAAMVDEVLSGSGLAFEIKDGLLLIGFGQDGVAQSVAALEDEGKRLALNRKTKAKDFIMFHTDFETAEALSIMGASDEEEKKNVEEAYKLVKDMYRAPLDFEMGFESLSDRFLVSGATNLREAMSEQYSAGIEDLKPVAGGRIRLFGSGSPMLALGFSLANLTTMKDHPVVNEGWKEVVEGLKEVGVTEDDMLTLLKGGLSIVLGGEFVSIEGINIPAVYLTNEGKDGVAAKVIGIAEENAKSLLNPVQASGWDKMYQVDTSVCPVPCLAGVQGETIFAGMMEASALSNTPETADRLSELLGKDSIGSAYIDFESIRVYLKNAIDGPLGSLLPMLGELTGNEAAGGIVESIKDVVNAKFSVPSVSLWAQDCETFFIDFANVEVPPEDGLWAKLVKAYQAFMSLSSGEEKKD